MVKWGFCLLTQFGCKALSHPLLLCNADKEEKKTFAHIHRAKDTEMWLILKIQTFRCRPSFSESFSTAWGHWRTTVWSSPLLVKVMLISLSHGHLTASRSRAGPRRPQSSRVSWPVVPGEMLSTRRTLVWFAARQGLALETVQSLGVNVWVCPERWMFEMINFRHKYLIISSICQFPVKRFLFPIMVTGDGEVREAGMPTGQLTNTPVKKKKKKDSDNHSMSDQETGAG